MKSTPEEIRARFDAEVDRFSNLQTGQSATVDAPLCMDLLTRAAALVTPHATRLLDLGCGAGNYSLKILQLLPSLDCTLIDLSRPMLDRAVARITPCTSGRITALQCDVRSLDLGNSCFDIVLAAATLHHLRGVDEWHSLFAGIHRALAPGGSFWIFDLIAQSTPAIQQLMQARYADYLIALKGGGPAGEKYRDEVFAYIAHEDTPRSLNFQLDLLKTTGFIDLEILHKNTLFAAFGARKPAA